MPRTPRHHLALWLLLALVASTSMALAAEAARVHGRVLAADGTPLVRAVVTLRYDAGASSREEHCDEQGRYAFDGVEPGSHVLDALAPGFSLVEVAFSLTPGESREQDLRLVPGTFTESLTVIGTRLGGRRQTLDRIPGSFDVIDHETLMRSQPREFGEALRQVPGVNVRDEEGFGLRPNIGLRGISPTRSNKVLLLEDGLFVTYAPYGDNASYYHPPIERMESVEVLKGAGQIAYGPTTVGGVMNYITPAPPREPAGHAALTAGSRDFLDAQVGYGATVGSTGLLLDVMRKSGDGSRDNVDSRIADVTFKLVQPFGERHVMTVKANHYAEDSTVTYSGLRDAEYRENPRQNPFHNDAFDGSRWGLSATHAWSPRPTAMLTTQLYGMQFSRDWWRQSSNSNQRPNDAADPACAGMGNLDTTCGNEGRLRDYLHWGVESRLRLSHAAFGVPGEAEIGARLHWERQEREQQNGATPTARSGELVEDNERDNDAWSLFAENRFLLDELTITPGFRVEGVRYERTNELANGGLGASGRTDLVQFVPGLGASYRFGHAATLFAGVHRGWAPPRTEDVVTQAGGVVDLDPELSWNYELGVRSEPTPGLEVDATLFRMDYENQVVPASVAGGAGATLTNGGATLHDGIELAARVDWDRALDVRTGLETRVAYTFLPTAEFTGVRFSNVPGSSGVGVSGNRLPYAPEHLLTVGLGWAHRAGFDAWVEAVHVGEQFGDDLNTVASSDDGQRGLLPDSTIWNAATSWHWKPLRSSLEVSVKNLSDRLYIVDRTRGILPGNPRVVQLGVRTQF